MPAATRRTPTTSRVSSARTGHAEAVQITFDPRVISYGKILQIYFSVAHNPTQLNRQGPDSGPQYRTEIFPQTDEQAKVAKAYIAQLDAAKSFQQPIVTKTGTDEGRVLSGRGLSPGLRHAASEQPLHRDQRRAEGRDPQGDCSRTLYRDKPVLVADAQAPEHSNRRFSAPY